MPNQCLQISSFENPHPQLVDAPQQTVPAGHVRIQMQYAPINPSDRNLIDGTYVEAMQRAIWNQSDAPLTYDPKRDIPCKIPPYTLGGEGMGVVTESGGGFLANRLQGKRVAVAAGTTADSGTWAQEIVVEARRAIALPSAIDDVTGSMFFVNPLTAWVMVTEVLKVQPDEWLLVTAAGSELGKMVIRLASERGFRVLAVVRREESKAELLALGAQCVVALETEDLISATYAATNGQGVPYALDCIGGELAQSVIQCLSRCGHMLVYGTLSGQPIVLPPRDIMMPIAKIEGFFSPQLVAYTINAETTVNHPQCKG